MPESHSALQRRREDHKQSETHRPAISRCIPMFGQKRNLSGSRNILAHLMHQQITGKPISQLRNFRRSTLACLRKTVKPRKLENLVSSVSQLHRRVFLGFLSGAHWLVSYQHLEEPGEMDDLDFGIVLPNGSSAHCVLEFWLYHPSKPIQLKYTRNLFSILNSSLLTTQDHYKWRITVYQWIEKPDHILTCAITVIDDVNITSEVVASHYSLTITYLPVPTVIPPSTCTMCLKGKSLPTFACVLHDCSLDIRGTLQSHNIIEPEKHLKIPNTLYLNMGDQKLYCVTMSHIPLGDYKLPKEQYTGDTVFNMRTTVYSGIISEQYDTDIEDVNDVYEDLAISCITNAGQYYIPLKSSQYSTELKQTCFIVQRSSLNLELLIIDLLYPMLCEKTTWYNSNCILKDWAADYVEICSESGTALCEMTFMMCQDPRYFNDRDLHICSVTFIWDPNDTKVEITRFEEGIIFQENRKPLDNNSLLLVRKAKSPTWVSKLDKQHMQPAAERAIIQLTNAPYIKGESLSRLVSYDGTAVITL